MIKASLFCFLILAYLPLAAQAPVDLPPADLVPADLVPADLVPADLVQRIQQEGLENSQVMNHLDYITNTIGHRLTGSDSFTEACLWAKGEFAKMGLDVRLEKWDQWKMRWNRGQWQGRVIQPFPMELHLATPAWTAGTKGRQRGLLVRQPKDLEQVAAMGETLRGAYVFGRTPSEGSKKGRALRQALQAAGILGYVQSSRGDAKYPNRIRVFAARQAYLRGAKNLPTVPEIVIRADQAEDLDEWLTAGQEVQVDFDIRNRFTKGPVDLHNVVAELKGTEKPEEFVVVCGHLDSWHQATGATDNGTGSSTTMEAARILTAVGAKPKRSIRFILWGGEEQGLLGSRAYCVRNRQELKNLSVAFNHDTGTNWAQNLTVTEAQYDDMLKILQPVFAMTPPDKNWDKEVFTLKKVKKIFAVGGSDHASFLASGTPALGWGLKGRSDYFGYTWHSQWDTYDVAIPEYQRHTATVIALAAMGAANLPNLLSREGVMRFRPKPDAILAVEGRLAAEFDGLTIKSVGDGVAKKAGLLAGDKIMQVGSEEVRRSRHLIRELRDQKPPWTFLVRRGKEEVSLQVTPLPEAKAEAKPEAKPDTKADTKAEAKTEAAGDG